MQHARRIRPPTGPIDRRRLLAAGLSAVLPGAGQLANGRQQIGRRLLVPSLVAIGLVWLVLQVVSLPRLAATLIAPPFLTILLVLNGLVLAWRLVAVLHAFFDQRFPGRSGRLGTVGLVLICAFVAMPHVIGLQVGLSAQKAFSQIFEPPPTDQPNGAEPTEAPFNGGKRVNILLIAIDKTPFRTATLTDTMMVASLDPVGKTVSLVSLPRDLVDAPLANGDIYAPKLNSLMSYADRHPEEFPEGGVAALQGAVGAIFDIDIHYYARIDFEGFIDMVDAVGGVDVVVDEGFDDPTYDGYGLGQGKGWSVEAGPQHFNGLNALAYARSRKAAGESDFSRQERQQEILIALRHKATEGGSLLFRLPGLIEAIGNTVRTDFPINRLPDAATILDEVDDDAITRVVIRFPLVGGARTEFGSVQIPDLAAIRAMAAHVFSEPGTAPIPWPTPRPTAPPVSPSASPAP